LDDILRIIGVAFRSNRIYLSLEDGREIGTPLAWYPRINNCTSDELARFRIVNSGSAIYWEDFDELLQIQDLLKVNAGYVY